MEDREIRYYESETGAETAEDGSTIRALSLFYFKVP